MPKPAQLPDNLWPLTQRQAIALRAESFEADATAISRSLTQLAVARRSQQVPVWTAGAALAAALATGVLLGPVVLQALHLPLFGLSAATQERHSRVVATEESAHKNSPNAILGVAADRLAALTKELSAAAQAVNEARTALSADAKLAATSTQSPSSIPPPYFRDCLHCPEMIVVPAGEFIGARPLPNRI